jgi:GTP-binding protein
LPNCGKSSLFNCLIGERLAIVDKEYGMTRDRREFTILNGMVTVIDTPGIEVSLLAKQTNANNFSESPEHSRSQLKQDIFQQSLNAIEESDMILFVIDAKK